MANNSRTADQLPNSEELSENISPRVPQQSAFGSRLYVIRYLFHGIRRHKRRSISLLIGVMIGVALVSSVFVWTETGARVAIDDYFASMPFHYYCIQRANPPYDDPRAIFPVKEFVDTQVTTQASNIVYSSYALIEANHRDSSDIYLPYPYMRGIKDCQVIFTDNDFLERAERSFRVIEGQFRVSPGSVLISQRVVDDLVRVMGLEVSVGSVIDVSIARNYRAIYSIGSIDGYNINGLRVAGIYEAIVGLEPIFEAFPLEIRNNWGSYTGEEPVFGWFDSIIISNDAISADVYEQISLQVMFPRLLVEINLATLYFVPMEEIITILERLFTDIQLQHNVIIGGRDQLFFLQDYIASFYERQTMIIILLPMIILSILLTTFTTSLFLSNRRVELAILRSRGASYQQLYSILMFEFLFLAIIAVVFGGFLGILLGCMIPSASAFLLFDLSIFMHHLSLTSINLMTWVIAGFVCILPAAAYTLINTRSFLKSELYSELRENNSRWKRSPKLQVAYAVGIIAISLPLFYVVVSIPFSVEIALIFFLLIVGFWILLADAIARIIRPGMAGVSKLFTPLIGQKSQIFAKGVRVRRTRVVPLLMILLLTFSITIFSAVEAQTYHTHLNQQISYYVGGDIRVFSSRVPATQVNQIASLSSIDTATAFIEVPVEVGQSDFRLLGVDPSAYAQVGNWDESSMVGESYQTVLARLDANTNGIILPEHLASRYNKRVGETINLRVYDQYAFEIEGKDFDIVGIIRTAPGLGYANPSDPQASVSPNPGFGFQMDNSFALCHQDYMLVEIPTRWPYASVDSTQFFLANINPFSDIETAQNAVESLNFVYTTWSPYTFDLASVYTEGHLFSQGIISLLSVGFLASLAISIVALTVFVSTIVSQRKTEFAIMRALGGTRRDVTAIVLVEFVSLIMLAFLFSLIVGSAFSWILMFVIIRLFPQPFIVPFTIIYPLSLLLSVLGLVTLGLLTGAYLPARRAGQVQVNTLLRNL